MRIVDYNTRPHELLGTDEGDAIFLKNNATTVVFGGMGNDEIYTPVNATREQIYGGYTLQDAFGTWFGHLIPAGYTQRQWNRVWNNDGNDIMHGGNADWMKGGGGADTAVWHPLPGGYREPGITFGFNPDEGDTIIFAHDRGFTMNRIQASAAGDFWDLRSIDLKGVDSDPILTGQWMRLDFTSDGRGPGVNHQTGAGDHHQFVPSTGHLIEDMRDFFREHDGGHYSPGADDAFIL